MMKIKNTKSPMKNNKTAKARLRGARAVCFDGQLIGYMGKTFREHPDDRQVVPTGANGVGTRCARPKRSQQGIVGPS
jgi:hypothetical protein